MYLPLPRGVRGRKEEIAVRGETGASIERAACSFLDASFVK